MNTEQQYTIDSESYPSELVDNLVRSYGEDHVEDFLRDSSIMASVLTSKEGLRSLLVPDAELGEDGYEEYLEKVTKIEERYKQAGGDCSHSGYSWYTMLRITWMRIVNGDLNIGLDTSEKV